MFCSPGLKSCLPQEYLYKLFQKGFRTYFLLLSAQLHVSPINIWRESLRNSSYKSLHFCLVCCVTMLKLWVGGFTVGLDINFCSESEFCSLILSRPVMILLSVFQFELLIGTNSTLMQNESSLPFKNNFKYKSFSRSKDMSSGY